MGAGALSVFFLADRSLNRHVWIETPKFQAAFTFGERTLGLGALLMVMRAHPFALLPAVFATVGSHTSLDFEIDMTGDGERAPQQEGDAPGSKDGYEEI